MIPSTFTLLVAATNLALSATALPIFSGFFAAPAAHVPSVQKRDLTDGQLAQGTNAFFRSLLLEDICTPGQVGCINNNTATCSPEGNWEVTPCPSSTTCLALPATPDSSSQSLVVKCTTQDSAVSAIEQAGGSQELAVDYSITTAPFNATVADVPDNGSNSTDTNTDVPTNTDAFTDVPTATDAFTDVPTATDAFTDVPTGTDTEAPSATCTPDDGNDDGGDDGSNDGSDDGSNDGSDDGSTDVPTDVPTGTDAATTPTGVCTDEPSEPTETEYITVIAFPDPSNTDSFTFSTIEPTDAETITLPDESFPTDTISQIAPVDAPTDSLTDTAVPTDTTTDTAIPTDTTTDTSVPTGTDAGVAATPTDTTPCVYPNPQQTSTDYTDSVTATETDIATATGTDFSGEPTTLVVPPNFSITTGPVPDINTVGTFAIPASPSAPVPIRRSGRMMQRKVRRS